MKELASLALALVAASSTGGAESGRSPAAPPPAAAGVAPGCRLGRVTADAARTADCVSCHRDGHAGPGAHAVGVDYARAATESGGRLRPEEQVVARGVFLPGGRLECVTCHDPRSPWKHHLALPPGAKARAAVDPRRRETYLRSAIRGEAAAAALPPGAAVTPTPLCLACHAFD